MSSYIYLPVPTPGLQKLASDLETRIHAQTPNQCRGTRRNLASRGKWKAVIRAFHGCLSAVGADDVLYVVIHGTGKLGMEKASAERNRAREVFDDPHTPKPVPNYLRPLGAEEIGDPGPPSLTKEYTAMQLAVTIEKEGLPKSHKLIELLACGAGLSDDDEIRAQEVGHVVQRINNQFAGDIKGAKGVRRDKMQEALELRLEQTAALVTNRHQTMDNTAHLPLAQNLKHSFGERFYDAMLARGYAGIKVHAYTGDVIPGTSIVSEGKPIAPFAVKTPLKTGKGDTYNPSEDGIRVKYPLVHH